MKRLSKTAAAAALMVSSAAWATNGMQMEGYGPEALAMGGAAMAYDNGTAAMMNNPATLQLGKIGTRADLALGRLGPNVTSMGEKSGGSSYLMPALGWVRTQDRYSFGLQAQLCCQSWRHAGLFLGQPGHAHGGHVQPDGGYEPGTDRPVCRHVWRHHARPDASTFNGAH